MRVLHCPHNIAGNPSQLARAERKLGLNSWAISFSEHKFAYDIDEVLFENPRKFINEITRLKLLFRVLSNFDVIHYNFGSTIMPSFHPDGISADIAIHPLLKSLYQLYSKYSEQFDMKVLKLLGKSVFVTFQGDDARQGSYCRDNYRIHFVHHVDNSYYTEKSDSHKKRLIKGFEKYADGIYALNPDLMNVLPSRTKFLPYSSFDIHSVKIHSVQNSTPLVLHAPSHREVKGTRYILEAVERLRSENVNFDFLLVENIAHAEAMELYKKADLLVDQVLAGWYGGLAVEFMALGRPVMAYIREEDLRHIPVKMKKKEELPIIKTKPDTIYSTLKRLLVSDKLTLKDIGARSRKYVENWHDPDRIASIVKKDYKIALKK